MKNALVIPLTIILSSCGNTGDKLMGESNENNIIPWGNNQLLEWKGDSLKSVFYWDSLTSIGPLRYTCFHYNSGDQFFDESVLLKMNETYLELIERLGDARIQYYKTCIECGDSNYWYGTEQNLEIITLYALIKMNDLDSSLTYLNSKSKKWRNSSRYADLYVALLMKKIGRSEIEKSLESIIKLKEQDSISIGNHWLHWQPIGEYNFNFYQDEIHWKHYFNSTMDRIEKIGI